MDKHLFRLIALMGAFAALFPLYAHNNHKVQELTDEEIVTVIVGDRAASSDAQDAFLENAPANPNDPGLPRFAIIGHDHVFYLGIGAQMLGDMWYDFGDNMTAASDFMPSAIVPKTPGNGSNLGFAAYNSTIFLNFVALPGQKNKVGLFFAGNFTNNYQFQMSHLYAKWRGLTVGYTNSAFTDGACIPNTIDNQGPNGVADIKFVTAYWVQNFGKGFSGAVGIDQPSAELTTNHTTEDINQRVPSFPLYLQYGWDSDSHVRVSGLLRPMQYRNLATNHNKTPLGYGFQLSATGTPTDRLQLYASVSWGKGIASYLQDDNGLDLDVAADSNRRGDMSLVETFGVTAGLSFHITDKLATNLVYSHLGNFKPDRVMFDPTTYRYGDYATANLIYSFNKMIDLGLEYNYGKKKTFGAEVLHTNRLHLQVAVNF